MTAAHFVVVADGLASVGGLLDVLPPGAPAEVVLLGLRPDEVEADAKAWPVGRVVAVPALSATAEADAVGECLRHLFAPGRVVVAGSAQWARDLAGWASVAVGATLVWAIDAVADADGGEVEAHRVVLGGSHRLVHLLLPSEGPCVVLTKPGSDPTASVAVATPPSVEQLDVVLPPARLEVVERAVPAAAGRPLVGSRVVVAVGRGIGGPQHLDVFRALAERLGAALGASRVAVDAGWLPFAHQVGQTGAAVAPDIYLAFGISGAIQHQAGMRGSRTIVTVNTDETAPLCRVADLVVKGDAVTVATALLDYLECHPGG